MARNKHPLLSANESQHSVDCLTLEQLIAYTEGKIPLSTRVKLEYHIRGCQLCADAVEGMSSFSDTGKVALAMQDLQNNFDVQTFRVQNRRRLRKIFAGIGLLLFFLSIAAILLSLLYQPDLADQFLKPYPNTVPMVRSQLSGNQLLQAMASYEKGDFGNAVDIFNEYLKKRQDNVTANFYTGVSRLLDNDPEGAISHLLKVRNNSENPFSAPAGWYLGLAYLKIKNHPAARHVFDEIIAGNGKYKSNSEKILSRLK